MNKQTIAYFAKKVSLARISFYFFDALNHQLRDNIFKFIQSLPWYFDDYIKFRRINDNENAKLSLKNLMPQLADKTSETPINYIYILQNAWACERIFKNKPREHVDVGSSVSFVSNISQFVPTTMVDIRKVDINLKNLKFLKGSLLKLPFKTRSLESLSSICVVEHLGLGRYGDPIDPYGTEKALGEISRVLKKGGKAILSVPVGSRNIVHFNAHREFIPQYIEKTMNEFKIIERKFIVGNKILNRFSKNDDNVVALYEFEKL